MSLRDWIFILPTWLNVLIVVSALLYVYGVWPYWTSSIPYPGPKPWPFIGNMKELFAKGVEEADTYNIKKYGNITLTWVARQPQLIISDLDMIKEINIKQFPKFVNRLVAKNRFALSKIESEQLTMLEDDHWKFVRSTLSPAFSSGRLKEMVPILQVCINNLEDAIAQRSKTGKSYDVKKIFEAYTLDAISTTAFGMESNVLKNPDDPIALLLRKFLDRRLSPLVMINLIFPFIAQIMQKFEISSLPKESRETLKVIVKDVQDIIKQRKQQVTNRRDLLQLMLDARAEDQCDVTLDAEVTPDPSVLENSVKKQRKHLTDTEVMAQSFVFLVAGYATTSATMSLLAYNLAVNPECQDKLVEEIDQQIKKEKPTYENVMQLPYLEMCLAETLRMFPATVRTTRETKEDVVVNGHIIPKGVGVQFSVGYLHHNPAYWPEPEKFKPERFTPEEKAKRSPYVYMPFGLGPRNCVGMRLAQLEAKMAMVAVLQKFRFVRSVDTEVPVKISAFGLAQPVNGIWLETQPREDI